jgi:hypothetical protein
MATPGLLMLGGCAPERGVAELLRPEADRFCALHAAPHRDSLRVDPPLPPAALLAAVAALGAQGYSRPAVEIADSIGALAQLQALAALQAAGPARGLAEELRRLRLRQAITERIMAAMLDASAVVGELDCEGERGDQLESVLTGIETRRTRRLTIAGILVGALTAGVSGGLGLGASAAAENIAGIIGGGAGAALGLGQLGGGESGVLRTERNLLAEVWEGPAEPRLFPPTVWTYLVRERVGPVGHQAGRLREGLIAAWRAGDRFGPPGSAEERDRIALIFGPGGRYTVADLTVRESCLELVQASVALMSRDLRLLLGDLQAGGGPGPGAGDAALAAARRRP